MCPSPLFFERELARPEDEHGFRVRKSTLRRRVIKEKARMAFFNESYQEQHSYISLRNLDRFNFTALQWKTVGKPL